MYGAIALFKVVEASINMVTPPITVPVAKAL
jgi:hypothetical protein